MRNGGRMLLEAQADSSILQRLELHLGRTVITINMGFHRRDHQTHH